MPRSKRFSRDKELTPNIHLTHDDHAIMLSAIRRRLITNTQLHALFSSRSSQKLTRRVRALFKVGLLDKPQVQVRLFKPGAGSNSHAVAITDNGVRAVEDYYKLQIPGSRWSRRNLLLRPQSVEHILETTGFMIAVETAVQKRNSITMRDGFDVVMASDQQIQKKSKPLSFTVPVKWNGRTLRRGIEPDELLCLTYADRPEGKNTANFVVEIDRGTETIEPGEAILKTEAFYRRSSILLKYVIYANAFHNQSCKCFGFGAFRMLMVTSTPSRMAEMQKLEEKYLAGRPYEM